MKIGSIFELSTQTIQNRVHTASLWSHMAARRPAMTALHHHAHLHWCQQHVHWNLNMLINVVLSDESRYGLWQLDRRFKTWKRHGERYADCYTDRVTAFLISTKNKACHHWISIHRNTEMGYGISSTTETLSSKMATLPQQSRIYHWLPPEFESKINTAFSPVLTCGISLCLTFVQERPTQLYSQTCA